MANTKIQTPAYPSAARLVDSDCYPQYNASLKCLEQFNSDKSKCQEHFDNYKECKKKEVDSLGSSNVKAIHDQDLSILDMILLSSS